MLHTKFCENPPTGSGEEDFWVFFIINGRGSLLGHVTRISIKLSFPLSMDAPHRISFTEHFQRRRSLKSVYGLLPRMKKIQSKLKALEWPQYKILIFQTLKGS